MLELSETQMAQMDALEQRDFVRRVHLELVAQAPELAADAQLLERLQAAHQAAQRFGIAGAGNRTQFLYQEAFAPSFWRQADIAGWLAKPGATPDQRWQDFIAAVKDATGGND